jgi:hypothetical protein
MGWRHGDLVRILHDYNPGRTEHQRPAYFGYPEVQGPVHAGRCETRNGFGYLIMHPALLDHVFWVGYRRVDFVSGPNSDWIHIHLFSHDSSH